MISDETRAYYDLKKRNDVRESAKRLRRQFLRYKDAEIVYSLQHKKLLELASEAGAIYRMDGTVLINRDNGIVDLTLGFLHKHLPHRKGTLISAELLGIHFSRLRSAVYHIQHIHRTVTNIRNHIDSIHCGGKIRNSGVPLRIDTDTLNRDMIVHLLIGEADLFVFAQISGKILFLPTCPSQG